MRLVGRRIGQIAFGCMLVVGVIMLLISVFSDATVKVPRDANGVLKSVKESDHYGWTSESVRRVDFGGGPVEQQALRSAVVDLKLNRLQVVSAGVLPERTTFVSAGKATRAVTATDEKAGNSPRVVNKVCAGQDPVAASTVTYPSAADILAADPKAVTADASVQGERAWLIDFTPTPTVLRKMFMLGFFDGVTENFPEMRPWVMSTAEREALTQGKVQTEYARAWVTRDGRILRQIEIKFRVDGASAYRMLAVLHPQNPNDRPLDKIAPGEVNCDQDAGGTVIAP